MGDKSLAQITEQPAEEAADMAFDDANVEPAAPTECDDRTSMQHFRRLMKRFETVRNISSPVLKLITI